MAGQKLALLGLHLFGLVVLVVVHAHEVQKTMHDQQGDLVVKSAGMFGRVTESHCGADDDVAEQDGGVFGFRGQPRAGTSRIRRPPAFYRLLVDRERQDVRRAVLAEEPAVQLGDGNFVHKKH